jgi:hypothetical protein
VLTQWKIYPSLLGLTLYFVPVTLSRERKRQMYVLSPSRERAGVLTNIGYPVGYEPDMIQRAIISPPPGQKCTAQVLRADFGTPYCASYDHVHSATVSMDTSGAHSSTEVDYNHLEWTTWQCRIYAPTQIPIPYGHMLVVEFVTDGNRANDGIGFRMSWSCEDFKTILI